jgi:hypothetical protein
MPPTERKRRWPSFPIAVTMMPTSSMWAQSITWGPRRPARPRDGAGSTPAIRLPMASISRRSTRSRTAATSASRTASSPPLAPGSVESVSRRSSRNRGAVTGRSLP